MHQNVKNYLKSVYIKFQLIADMGGGSIFFQYFLLSTKFAPPPKKNNNFKCVKISSNLTISA